MQRRTIASHLDSTNVQRQAGFYYDNRLKMLESAGQFGLGIVDYEYHRARARAQRELAMRRAGKRAVSLVRPLVAIAILLTAIWMLASGSEPCGHCSAAAQIPLIR